MSQTVLVTGGAGFIGSFLTDALVGRGDRVIVYDNLEPQVHPLGKAPAYLNRQAEFIRADIRDRAQLERAVMRADVISHQAAMLGVGQSMYQVERFVDATTRGTAVLVDLLVNAKHHVRKVVVASSMSAYGEGRYRCPRCGPMAPPVRTEAQMDRGVWEIPCPRCSTQLEPVPTDEGKPFQINSVYALTKQDQEQLVLSVCGAFGLAAVALRYFNVYGPRQSLDNPYTGVAAIFLSRLKNDRPPLVFEDGRQSRDFVSVHDIVAANLRAIDEAAANGEVFNVGSGRRYTIIEIAERLATLLGKDIQPTVAGKFRKGDIRHCYADISKITSALGWTPKVEFETGMRELSEWSSSVSAADNLDAATEELRERGLLAA